MNRFKIDKMKILVALKHLTTDQRFNPTRNKNVDNLEMLNNAHPITTIADIKDGDRLFYELSWFKTIKRISIVYETHEERERVGFGIFEEITNVSYFLNKEKERLNDPKFIKHHNYVIIRTP